MKRSSYSIAGVASELETKGFHGKTLEKLLEICKQVHKGLVGSGNKPNLAYREIIWRIQGNFRQRPEYYHHLSSSPIQILVIEGKVSDEIYSKILLVSGSVSPSLSLEERRYSEAIGQLNELERALISTTAEYSEENMFRINERNEHEDY